MKTQSILGLATFLACFINQAGAQENPAPAPQFNRTVLPIAPEQNQSVVGLRSKDSKGVFPRPVTAPDGAPNVLLVLLDDVGFGASSTFGGAISTPNIQKLADNGIRYNRFHTTAVCSPTRAALITGRNHHTAHTGVVMEMATGYDGYNSLVGKDMATIGEMLKLNGYNTAWFGKNHNVADWESTQAGPFDRWPTGMGFEKFYGFLGGVANNWRPALYDGTTPIEPHIGKPDYNLDFDLADKAIEWIQMQKTVAPQKPFLCYIAPGAIHAPQHATPEWIAKYKGKFDMGWDKLREETFARQKQMGIIPADAKLTPRPKEMPSWDSMSDRQKKVMARMMEVAAGQLSQVDYNFGRVMKAIDDMGQTDNTLVIYVIGDNGGSGEGTLQGVFNDMNIVSQSTETLEYLEKNMDDMGGWKSSNLYGVPWAWATNTPFQWTKQVASHFGGTRNGLVISWPKGIKARGEIRSQFSHVIDIVPTILEAAGLPQPTKVNGTDQHPIEGTSMVYTFDDAKAEDRRKTQYFEIFGNSGIYHDGWFAGTTPFRLPWSGVGTDADVLTTKWELYNIDKDFSQAEDLAEKMPEKLREMQVRFYAEAAKHSVLPIQTSAAERFGEGIRPSMTGDRKSFTYTAGLKRIPEGTAPPIKNRSWSITTELTVKGDESGVIVTQGGILAGWAFYFEKGKPVFSYSFTNGERWRFAAKEPLPAGKHKLVMDFTYDGGGMGKGGNVSIKANDKVIAEGKVGRTVPFRFSTEETLDIGEDTGTPVDLSYDVPATFTGELGKVVIDLK
jgi:arylsulfatase